MILKTLIGTALIIGANGYAWAQAARRHAKLT